MNFLVGLYIFLSSLFLFYLFCFFLMCSMLGFSFSVFSWEFFVLKLLFSFSSLLFFCVLLVVVFGVFLFSSFYLGRESSFVYFFTLLLIFIVSMVLLNFSSSFLLLLVSWDLLGISSYFLVLFYNNWDSDVGSMNVALTNRLGDFFLFFAFVFFFCTSVSLHVFEFLFFISFLFIWIAGFTNSAQFPFSSWLPKAISAPTPVSALVHSSTLVTAGLVLMMKFNFLVLGLWLSLVLGLVGLFTMFFSSGLALVEQDIKNVVALSTLSQMGFSCFVLSLSLSFFSLFHLLSHALFNSCLFIQVGYLIYSSLGQQDGRAYSGLSWGFTFLRFQLLLTLFCLCGMFFTSGLVSKDFVLEFFLFVSVKFFLVLLFLVSVFLTFFYSFRLWSGLFAGGFSFLYVCVSSGLQFVVSFLLSVFALSFVWFLSKNCVFVPLYGLYFSVWTPVLFVVFFFLVWFLFLKLFSLLLFWGFLVDFLARQFSFHLFNFRFFDLLLNRGLFSFFLLFNSAGGVSFGFFFVCERVNFCFVFLFVCVFVLGLYFKVNSCFASNSGGLSAFSLLNNTIFGLLSWFCWDLYFNKNFFFTRSGWCGLFVSGVYFFVFVFSLLSFYSYDPMKSCLFLVASVLSLSFVFDYSSSLWFSYFVCMLFLSGIFVILVYFSSMSNFYYFAFSFFELFLVLFVSLLSVVFFCWRFFVFEGLGVFYCGFYFFHFVFLLFSLVLFLLFVSYFLSFTGALRGF